MENEIKINSLTIQYEFEYGERDVAIVEIKEGNDLDYKYYWIHTAHHIDAIYCNQNKEIRGLGARKYEDIIRNAVEMFKRKTNKKKKNNLLFLFDGGKP